MFKGLRVCLAFDVWVLDSDDCAFDHWNHGIGCLVVSVVWPCGFCRLFVSTCLDVRHFSLDAFVSFICV